MITLPNMTEEEEFLGRSRQVMPPAMITISPAHQQIKRTTFLTEAPPGGDFSASPKLPDWFFDAAKDIACLMALNADWDSYGGEAIDLTTAAAALRVLIEIGEPDLPRPSIFPESAGGVVFEFRHANAELTLIVHRADEVSYFCENSVSGLEREGEGLPEFSDFIS